MMYDSRVLWLLADKKENVTFIKKDGDEESATLGKALLRGLDWR